MNNPSTEISHLMELSLGQMTRILEQILSLIFAFANLRDAVKEVMDDTPSAGAGTHGQPGCSRLLVPSGLLRLLFGKKPATKIGNLPPAVFKISLAHPKFLSKRFASPFVIHIYLPEARKEVDERLKTDLHEQESTEHLYDSDLTIDQIVQIKLQSPEITFPDPITKKLTSTINRVSFLGKPNDDCQPGIHWANLIISDAKTGHEIQSMNYSVQVVDFAFDHVSRPLLSNTMSFILGIGSLTTYVLTLLGQIDTTYGLASGTTAGVIATFIHIRFLTLYQRLSTNSNP